MLGKINKDGCLEIKRNGYYKEQWCAFVSDSRCSDSCPLFGEIEYNDSDEDEDEESLSGKIEICQGKILDFIEISDER